MGIVWRLILIKINKKLSISISLILLIVGILSIIVNSFFTSRYYIYKKSKELNKLSLKIEDEEATDIIKNINSLDKETGLIIVYTKLDKNINDLNNELIFQLDKKKIKLNKFWVTEETLEQIKNKSINKVYNQGQPNYSFLTKFIEKDDYIFSIGMALPNINDTISIINEFNIYLIIALLIIIGILVFVFCNRLIKPIEKLRVLSKDIENLNFRTEIINTNDEIEDLADSINSMSINLEKAHSELNAQNETLKKLLAGVSHELKTPVALIKAYAQGIEDGLDDGSYAEIILDEAYNMEELIERLLYWARIQRTSISKSNFDLKELINKSIDKYSIILKENNIDLKLNIDRHKDYDVYADYESIKTVINNLITNAIKYTSDKSIEITFNIKDDFIVLSISNGVSNLLDEDIKKFWTPFYVAEKSRNKNLSGTGVGLPIVKSILESNEIEFNTKIEQEKIKFNIYFKRSTD
ncbi:sensor histidine kinase [Clostridium sardiniense]